MNAQSATVRVGTPGAVYLSRRDAGQLLGVSVADAIPPESRSKALVLGIARGGVVVAAEVARTLAAELDVLVVRKIGAPGAPELGIGAATADGVFVLLPETKHMRGVTPEYVHRTAAHAIDRARQLERTLRADRPAPIITGRTVVLVDDGLATGSTARAALRSVSHLGPSRVIYAAPVGAVQACRQLEHEVSLLLCPLRLDNLRAVSRSYQEFEQVDAQEVTALLASARAGLGTSALRPVSVAA
jgi:putative phosphoribosyl transferase